jgi:hypothetical protein
MQFFTGLLIIAPLVLAYFNIIQWSYAVLISLVLLITTLYLSPYYTTLSEIEDSKKNIIGKWMAPFFKWQILIIFYVIFLNMINVSAQIAYEKNTPRDVSIIDKIEATSSEKELKEIAKTQDNIIILASSMLSNVLEINSLGSAVLTLLLICNLLFYQKIKHQYNKAISADAKNRAAD